MQQTQEQFVVLRCPTTYIHVGIPKGDGAGYLPAAALLPSLEGEGVF